MGTNYYLDEEVCPHCRRPGKRLHIGKSAAGWAFLLHVDSDEGLNGLKDWVYRWERPNSLIVDEHGRPVAPLVMFDIIARRPPGLLTSFHNCIGHFGSYDHITGEFR